MSGSNGRVVNPTACTERPWDQWIEEIGHASPEQDEEPPEEKGSRVNRRRRKIGRLKRNTMGLHGFVPHTDNLNAVVCFMCGATVKLCAAHRHLTDCHPELPPPPAPRPAPARSRQRKEPVQQSQTIRLEPEPPVMSIRDTSSPLVDVGDDIFEIMNSEGIRSADDPPDADWRSIVRDIATTLANETPPKPKSRPRPKDYDPDRHCGVLTADAKPCVRSLTCKAHPVSMRRSVDGRSKPFDTLLAEKRAATAAAAAGVAQAQVQTAPSMVAPQPTIQVTIPKASPVQMVSPVTPTVDTTFLNNLPTLSVPDELLADTPAELLQRADDLYGALLAAQDVIPPEVAELVSQENCLPSVPVVSMESVPQVVELSPTKLERPMRLDTPEDEIKVPTASPAAVWWYATSPRPLALCTFGATSAGGATLLGRRYATVRADVKSSLSRGAARGTGLANRNRGGKVPPPEVRKLVIARVDSSTTRLNGQIISSRKNRLSFSLDPLLEDKC